MAQLRIPGIRKRQLSHYVNNFNKATPATKQKIEFALHQLGKEHLALDLEPGVTASSLAILFKDRKRQDHHDTV